MQTNPVKFDVTYAPEKKDGFENPTGRFFTYSGDSITGEYFSKGFPAGFQAVVNGEPRRFAYIGVKSLTISHG